MDRPSQKQPLAKREHAQILGVIPMTINLAEIVVVPNVDNCRFGANLNPSLDVRIQMLHPEEAREHVHNSQSAFVSRLCCFKNLTPLGVLSGRL